MPCSFSKWAPHFHSNEHWEHPSILVIHATTHITYFHLVWIFNGNLQCDSHKTENHNKKQKRHPNRKYMQKILAFVASVAVDSKWRTNYLYIINTNEVINNRSGLISLRQQYYSLKAIQFKYRWSSVNDLSFSSRLNIQLRWMSGT